MKLESFLVANQLGRELPVDEKFNTLYASIHRVQRSKKSLVLRILLSLIVS